MKPTPRLPDPSAPAPTTPATVQRDDARDATDRARDDRLLEDLQENSGRDPLDLHRERLTPVEAEQDGVREDEEDDERGAQALLDQAVTEQEADERDPG